MRDYFAQICAGVEYLHSNLVVHRDVKLENLLLHNFDPASGRPPCVKIVDFGFAVKLNTATQKLKVLIETLCGGGAPRVTLSMRIGMLVTLIQLGTTVAA